MGTIENNYDTCARRTPSWIYKNRERVKLMAISSGLFDRILGPGSQNMGPGADGFLGAWSSSLQAENLHDPGINVLGHARSERWGSQASKVDLALSSGGQ